MAIELAAGYRRLKSGSLDAWVRNLVAGAICALVSLAFSLSYAALIFSGPLTPWLAYGMAATFVAGAVGGLVMLALTSLPFALAGPDSSTSAVTAALVAALAGHLVAEGGGDHLLGPTLIVLCLSAALSGLLLCALGLLRAGRAVRFVPYPVIGGFLGASGWLIAAGAIQVTTGHRFWLAELGSFLDGATFAKLAASIGVAVVLLVGRLRFRGPFALPIQLLACAAAVYVGLLVFGVSLTDAQKSGWMFQAPTAAAFSPPWDVGEWRRFPWHLMPTLSADFVAVMFVSAVSILLNVTGLEFLAKREADLDRDLSAVGVSSLLSALLGGYVNGVPLSRSTLSYRLAANSRIPTFCVAATSAAMLGISPAFLAYVPKCVLGGLLFSLGVDVLYRWLVASARQLSRVEYLSLIVITLIIVNWGFVAGILIGIVIGCATFALSASRVSAIKFSFDGSEYRSTLDRGPKELALLAEHGRELQGMSLQSYLFFGSANQLYQNVKELFVRRPECRYLLFDFRLVTGIDSSATHSFTQIKQVVDKCGAQLVLVNLSPALTNAFRAIRFISDDIIVVSDLDRALESCENGIIDAHRIEDDTARSLQEWLTEALGNPDHAEQLAEQCRCVEFEPGDVVARQGDRADCMHFILKGRVGIIVNLEDGRSVRVRSLGAHTTIGEMGLITHRPRSATIQAEVPSVLYELSTEAFNRLREQSPHLSQALLTYVVGVMAERLSFASRAIGVLQR